MRQPRARVGDDWTKSSCVHYLQNTFGVYTSEKPIRCRLCDWRRQISQKALATFLCRDANIKKHQLNISEANMLMSACGRRHKPTALWRLLQWESMRRTYSVYSGYDTVSPDLTEKLRHLQAKKLPILYDVLAPQSSHLLTKSLDGFLPRIEKAHESMHDKLLPGHHLAYFRSPISTAELLPDGTDVVHSPGEPWTQRLWAGGSLTIHQNSGISYSSRTHILIEDIPDVQVIGSPGSERIFVTIRRIIKEQARPSEGAEHMSYDAPPSSSQHEQEPLLVEHRTLCFLKDAPGRKLVKPRPPISPPLNPDFSHALTPTSALLFRFSALTFNAHAIHIDPEYTRTVYQLPKLLVHGPLTLVLMLEVMRRALYKYDTVPGNGVSHVVHIDYKNLVPLFVDEEMTICCKRSQANPTTIGTAKADQSLWTVWIEKSLEGKPAMAVKATVRCAQAEEEREHG